MKPKPKTLCNSGRGQWVAFILVVPVGFLTAQSLSSRGYLHGVINNYITLGKTAPVAPQEAITPLAVVSDMPVCNGHQYRNGRWRKSNTPVAYDLCKRHLHRNCAAIDNFNQLNGSMRVDQSLQWQWHPHNCNLHKFTPQSLKELLLPLGGGRRRIIYVGDSLNHDMSQSMRCLLGEEQEDLVSLIRSDRLGCPDKECSNSSQVRQEWQNMVKDQNLQSHDILVVNTGAHWFGDPNEQKLAFQNIATSIASVFNGTVVMRTTVMGHDSCQNFTEPTIAVEDAEMDAKTVPMSYNWANFSQLNSLVHDAFLNAGFGPRYHPLYVDMFEQRGDGHVQNSFNYDMQDALSKRDFVKARGMKKDDMDCLHYCVPGPIHVWNELLYHLLREAESTSFA